VVGCVILDTRFVFDVGCVDVIIVFLGEFVEFVFSLGVVNGNSLGDGCGRGRLYGI